jgi:hypothetical protein
MQAMRREADDDVCLSADLRIRQEPMVNAIEYKARNAILRRGREIAS